MDVKEPLRRIRRDYKEGNYQLFQVWQQAVALEAASSFAWSCQLFRVKLPAFLCEAASSFTSSLSLFCRSWRKLFLVSLGHSCCSRQLLPVTVLMLPCFALFDHITAVAVLSTVSQLRKHLKSLGIRCSVQQQLSALHVYQISAVGHSKSSFSPLPAQNQVWLPFRGVMG